MSCPRLNLVPQCALHDHYFDLFETIFCPVLSCLLGCSSDEKTEVKIQKCVRFVLPSFSIFTYTIKSKKALGTLIKEIFTLSFVPQHFLKKMFNSADKSLDVLFAILKLTRENECKIILFPPPPQKAEPIAHNKE